MRIDLTHKSTSVGIEQLAPALTYRSKKQLAGIGRK